RDERNRCPTYKTAFRRQHDFVLVHDKSPKLSFTAECFNLWNKTNFRAPKLEPVEQQLRDDHQHLRPAHHAVCPPLRILERTRLAAALPHGRASLSNCTPANRMYTGHRGATVRERGDTGVR